MSRRTISEALVEHFFTVHGVRYRRVPRSDKPTPDAVIELAQPVVCEVKQIEPNDADLADVANPSTLDNPHAKGRWVPNRLRGKFNRISRQLQRASKAGTPTLLVVYDATPFQLYSDDLDIVQANSF